MTITKENKCSTTEYNWDDFTVADAIAMYNSATVFCHLVIGYYPHPYQIELLENNSRRIIVVWGRQLGKTFTLAVKAIWFAVTRKNKRVVILAPAKKQAQIMYKEIQKIINQNKWLQQSCIKNIQSEIVFENGSTIINHTVGMNNAKSLKGESIDLLLIDEFELLEDPLETWGNVQPCTSSTHGTIIIISTPISKKGLFYTFFLLAKKIKNEITKKFEEKIPIDSKGLEWSLSNMELLEDLGLEFGLPSTYGLHFIRKDTGLPQVDKESIWEARNNFDEIKFKQEYLAMFLDEEISYFTKQDIINAKRYQYSYVDRDKEGDQALCVDWGGRIDSTVMSVVKKCIINEISTTEEIIKVLNRWEFKPSDYTNGECDHNAEITFIKNVIYPNFNLAFIFTDPGSVGYEAVRQLIDFGSDKGIDVIKTSFNQVGKRRMYGRIKVLMQQGRWLMSPYDKVLEEQLLNIRYDFSDLNKQINFFIPKGFHDDYVDSVAGATMLIEFEVPKSKTAKTSEKLFKERLVSPSFTLNRTTSHQLVGSYISRIKPKKISERNKNKNDFNRLFW